MEMYKIYVVLTRTNSIMSNLIKFIKKDYYTHAAISLDKELNFMYGFGRKYTYNPFIGAFKKEDINTGLYKFQKRLPGIIIEIRVSEKQYEKFKILLDEFTSNSSKYKYNSRGIFYTLLNKEVNLKDRFLCSEFVYYLLKESNIVDWNISPNLIRPQHLTQLDGRLVYRGDLKKLKPETYSSITRKTIQINRMRETYE